MKRIYIWLSSFNLVQQFISIVIFTIFIFMFFSYSLLSQNIDSFINNQMVSYLHRYQQHYLSSETSNFLYTDTNVDSYVYSVNRQQYLSKIDERNSEIISLINPVVTSTYDGLAIDSEKVSHVYSVTKLESGNYTLVSIVSNEYISEFKTALVRGVINVVLYVCAGLFVLFLLWVVSLISPLKYIRNYIDKLKDGEKPELNLKRNDEIGEVAEALISMNQEVSKQEKIREEMVQNISHDLKTPIATIKSYAESIKDGIYPYGTLENSVDVIIEHANRLEKKAYNLNTFNKLGYLTDTDNEINMANVIQKAILSTQAIRKDIKIETNVDDSVMFHGEEEPWRTVVENLIDNALRYAKTLVRIDLKDRLLEVFNDGDLMSKERIDKLFKPYEKGTKGNFGLGLSIVKKVCETYGYNVIGDNMDNGVIFRVYTNKTNKRVAKKQNSK